MSAILAWLTCHGGLGMFISAFLAGSVLPFSSEAVLVALLAVHADPWQLLLWGVLGNTLGSMLNYGIGLLGREEWITKYAKVSPEKLQKGIHNVRKYGWWIGFLAWLPILGGVFTVAMGYLRINIPLSLLAMVLGKLIRYYIIIYAYQMA